MRRPGSHQKIYALTIMMGRTPNHDGAHTHPACSRTFDNIPSTKARHQRVARRGRTASTKSPGMMSNSAKTAAGKDVKWWRPTHSCLRPFALAASALVPATRSKVTHRRLSNKWLVDQVD